jgi:hypothetical protein
MSIDKKKVESERRARGNIIEMLETYFLLLRTILQI